MRNQKRYRLIYLFIFIFSMFIFFINLNVTANIYIIKDKQGNTIRITSQHQMMKKEKEAGCTITILIEDKKDPTVQSRFQKYDFKERIDWDKCRNVAQVIEQKIKNQSANELHYPVYQVLATAYTPDERCCAPYADGYTATGYPAGYGSIAIDPDYGMFQYGDILYVEGYGLGVADDCGSAIKGRHIDVCFNLGELEKADDWGRRNVRVWKIE